MYLILRLEISPITSAFAEKNNMLVVKPISLGPWGGWGGTKWTQNNDGKSVLAGLIICYGERIDSIVIKSVHEGNTVYTKEYGRNFGLQTEKIMFDYPHEHVKSISGYYGPLAPGESVTIRSLTFATNVKKYGPIGSEDGTQFTLQIEDGTIVGFHGRYGYHLDAIGVYVKPTGIVPKEEASIGQAHLPRLSRGKELPVAAAGVGPWGGAGGRPFDDGVYTGIRNIYVQRGYTVVHSILIEYDQTGQSVRRKYGGEGGSITNEEKNNMLAVKPISLGPWGGWGGTKWTQNSDGKSVLAGLIICYGERIDSIVIKSVHEGNTVYTEEYGRNFGLQTEKIMFDYPHEHVKSISGYYGPLAPGEPVTIRSLTFATNVKKYGPIGSEDGTQFTLQIEDGTIVGFHGRYGYHLDAIGVYVKPTGIVPKEEASIGQAHLPRLSMGKELPVAAAGVGPWGGAGGRPFDDGVYTGIRNIYVQRRDTVVHSILIEYDQTGQSVRRKYGGEGGFITEEVCLDFPRECLISISGFYGKIEGHEVLTSLSFNTTKARYGPFGEEIGLFFSSGEVPAKIVGFHGRSGKYLNAIGVVREYFKCTIPE